MIRPQLGGDEAYSSPLMNFGMSAANFVSDTAETEIAKERVARLIHQDIALRDSVSAFIQQFMPTLTSWTSP